MDFSKDLSVVVLAAGEGKRMKSEVPKVLHHISGKPILYHILSTIEKLNPGNTFVVVGYKKEAVIDYIKNHFKQVKVIIQERQLGTANAVYMAKDKRSSFGKYTLVLSADTPMVSPATLKRLVESKDRSESGVSIITSLVPEPGGYGRIIKDGQGNIVKIIEEADATREEKKINEINSSIYCFDTGALFENIGKVKAGNAQKEYYLTDIIGMLVKEGKKVSCLRISDYVEVMGINNRLQLSSVGNIMQKRINEELMENGVTIRNPESCYIESTAVIEKDVIIEPYCFIKGETRIGKNSVIGPFCQIIDSIIGKRTRINSSVIIGSHIGNNNNIGPYSYMRFETLAEKDSAYARGHPSGFYGDGK
jgi:bifunctional UDP-N-acetylglucosamine pyrophosphorylase / glucosamine-1-phosphate N-acetyltransferase